MGDPYKSLVHWQGRKEEIAQFRQWLQDADVNLMGIEGVGGVGKSTLATKIFCEEVEGWERYWVDVSLGDNFADFARGILTKFGAYIPEEKELVRALIGCLQREHCFLVVDNLESLLQEEDRQWNSLFYGDFFGQWIECGGKSKILVTTRERPNLKGFRQWISLKGLKVEEGVQLFQDLGIGGDLAAFSRLVDGYPLILRLVADFLLEEFSEDPNLERFPALGELRELLRNPQIKGQHRRQEIAIEFVFDESFNRLSEIQKELLLNASVYRGEFDAEMARAVLGDSEEDSDKIEAELKNLVKRSLLEARLSDKYFFEFQPVIWEYIRNKAGEQGKTHHQAIKYYRDWLNSAQTRNDIIKGYREIVYHFYQLEDYDTAFDTIQQIDEFLTLQGLTTVRIELYKPLVQVWQQKNDKKNTKKHRISLNALGETYHQLYKYDKAIDCYQKALAIAKQKGNRVGDVSSLDRLGNSYCLLREYETAIHYHQQSLDIKRRIGDRAGEGGSLCNLGHVYYSWAKYKKAIEYYEQALKVLKPIKHYQFISNTLVCLGDVYSSLGEHEKARNYCQQSLKIRQEIGDRPREEGSLAQLGCVYNSLGEYRKAVDYIEQSLNMAKEMGSLVGEGASLCNLGYVYYSWAKYKKAIEYYEQALKVLEPIKHHQFISNTLVGLGDTYAALKQPLKAIEYHEQSLIVKRRIGDKRGEMHSLQSLGSFYLKMGQMQKGIAATNQAIEIARELGLPLTALLDRKWLKSLIRFTQRSNLHLILCFVLGFIAFPIILILIILEFLLTLIRAPFYRK